MFDEHIIWDNNINIKLPIRDLWDYSNTKSNISISWNNYWILEANLIIMDKNFWSFITRDFEIWQSDYKDFFMSIEKNFKMDEIDFENLQNIWISNWKITWFFSNWKTKDMTPNTKNEKLRINIWYKDIWFFWSIDLENKAIKNNSKINHKNYNEKKVNEFLEYLKNKLNENWLKEFIIKDQQINILNNYLLKITYIK